MDVSQRHCTLAETAFLLLFDTQHLCCRGLNILLTHSGLFGRRHTCLCVQRHIYIRKIIMISVITSYIPLGGHIANYDTKTTQNQSQEGDMLIPCRILHIIFFLVSIRTKGSKICDKVLCLSILQTGLVRKPN